MYYTTGRSQEKALCDFLMVETVSDAPLRVVDLRDPHVHRANTPNLDHAQRPLHGPGTLLSIPSTQDSLSQNMGGLQKKKTSSMLG